MVIHQEFCGSNNIYVEYCDISTSNVMFAYGL